MTRNPHDLIPFAYEKFLAWDARMKQTGIPYIITRVACSLREQVALYAQGRETLSAVNHLRKVAHLPEITQAQNIVVTWTLNSRHIINLDDHDPMNNQSKAFDIAITDKKVPTWSLKVDVNEDHIPDYQQAGEFWKALGGIWGGDLKDHHGKPLHDYCHFEV